MILALKDESSLVSCAITETFPLSAKVWLDTPEEELTETAKWAKEGHLDTVKHICTDWEK